MLLGFQKPNNAVLHGADIPRAGHRFAIIRSGNLLRQRAENSNLLKLAVDTLMILICLREKRGRGHFSIFHLDGGLRIRKRLVFKHKNAPLRQRNSHLDEQPVYGLFRGKPFRSNSRGNKEFIAGMEQLNSLNLIAQKSRR